MATLETVLNVETEVESVIKTLLASTYGLGAVTTDTAAALTTPRVECIAVVTRWGPHQYQIAGGTYAGRHIYDQFQLRLAIDVVYQPEHGQGQGSIRGKLRKALSDRAGLESGFNSNAYLYHAPDSLRQIDGGRIVDTDENTETLSTVLELVVFARPAALEAAT